MGTVASGSRASLVKKVSLPYSDGPRLRRLHLKPAGRAGARVLPGMRHAGWNQSEVAGAERVRLLTDLRPRRRLPECRSSLQTNAGAVAIDAAGIEKADAGTHVNGSHRAIHVGGAAETGAVRPVKLGRLRGGWVDLGDSVHGVVDLLWLLFSLREAGRKGAIRKLTFVNRIVTQAGASKREASPFQVQRAIASAAIEFLKACCASGNLHNSSGELSEGSLIHHSECWSPFSDPSSGPTLT